jgi:hypothetical protein
VTGVGEVERERIYRREAQSSPIAVFFTQLCGQSGDAPSVGYRHLCRPVICGEGA